MPDMTLQQTVRVGAYAVCVRDGQILLTHQAAPGPAQGQWTLPGGGVEFGEDPASAAARECCEETGLKPLIGEPLGVYSDTYAPAPGVECHGIRILFEATFEGALPTPTEPNDGEIDGVGWFPTQDLPQPITAWAPLGCSLALSRRQVSNMPV